MAVSWPQAVTELAVAQLLEGAAPTKRAPVDARRRVGLVGELAKGANDFSEALLVLGAKANRLGAAKPRVVDCAA